MQPAAIITAGIGHHLGPAEYRFDMAAITATISEFVVIPAIGLPIDRQLDLIAGPEGTNEGGPVSRLGNDVHGIFLEVS